MKTVKRLFRDDIEIDQIDSSPFQPRLEFKLEKLKEKIAKEGILVPLMVRLVKDRYELIDGERRWRVAKEFNYKTVVCDEVEATDEEADDWIWDTNESRESYEPKERALRYKRFRDQNMFIEQIAKKHNDSEPTVRLYLGVFKLPSEYQELVWDRKIGIGIIKQVLPFFLNERKGEFSTQIIKILDKAKSDPHYGWEKAKEDVEKLNGKIKEEGQKIVETSIDAKIETPEDYEKAAKLLKEEAQKKREEALTEEEKAKIKEEKEAKEIQQKEKQEQTARLKKEREEQLKQEKEEEIQKRAIKQARELKKEELIKDNDFVKEVISEHEKARQRELAAQPKQQISVPLPEGKYRTITIDPPWPMSKIHRKLRLNQIQIKLDYPTMTLKEIEALPIPDLAYEDGCHIYLWATHKYLPDALKILNAWGAEYECQLTWVKNVGITPFSWMYSTEHCLFARIGNLPLVKLGRRLDFRDTVREHSRKPDKFYNLVREVSPEPRIDMFSREERDGFGQYGNELDKFNFKEIAVVGR